MADYIEKPDMQYILHIKSDKKVEKRLIDCCLESVVDVFEDTGLTADIQEKKYCKMIPLELDSRGCTNVFICPNCHQYIYLGFIQKEYSGSYCSECGAEVKDGDTNG